MARHVLGLDIGSNSVGSAWIDLEAGTVATGISVFPAGVEESDDKRGDPKNVKRRNARRARITLARRAARKRALRRELIVAGLLPPDTAAFEQLLASTDPWELRRRGLDKPLTLHEFGRVLLHLAQRRGALGLRSRPTEGDDDLISPDDGKVLAAIDAVRREMMARKSRTFGQFIADLREERAVPIHSSDNRRSSRRVGARVYHNPVRNRASTYEHCADRDMIRDEFSALWTAQRSFSGPTARALTDDLREKLDNSKGDSTWRHRGLLFGQRRASWDLGTLGRCSLEPTDRCVPHADMYASRYLVVETLNNLRILEPGKAPRPLTPEERSTLSDLLSGPLGTQRRRGAVVAKRSATVTDLRRAMGWGRSSDLRFNIESDSDRSINTDWFSRELIHGAVGLEAWDALTPAVRNGINQEILRRDPDYAEDEERFRRGLSSWSGLSPEQIGDVVAAWKARPRPDGKRLNLSRRAVRNLLTVMDRTEPWPDERSPTGYRWLTQIEARRLIAADADFVDVTSGHHLDDRSRWRYAMGTRGASARDRYYMRKHRIMRNGEVVLDRDGRELSEPPPAPLIRNPVVRKAIHEVRRHLIDYMRTFGRKPDAVIVELSREARMNRRDADRVLFMNRLRSRIRGEITEAFGLGSLSSTQQRAAVARVVLAVQQDGICPLCGQPGLTELAAARGSGCEVAHIIPRASGGHNGFSNIVLAHTPCNRDMGRRTPREYWGAGDAFEAGIGWANSMYGTVERPRWSELRSATGKPLWKCYFTSRDDHAKLRQFSRDISDIRDMTAAQSAATSYSTRQVLTYLSDALYDGGGLPERGGERRIYATDGTWTARFRREWGLFLDAHNARDKSIDADKASARREKDRGDHRQHAVDAVAIALGSDAFKAAWGEREESASRAGVNVADDSEMEAYRAQYPLPVPSGFGTRERLQAAMRSSVYGDRTVRPVSHRPTKRRLVGALHEETLRGAVIGEDGRVSSEFTTRKRVSELKPDHLRLPVPESPSDALRRLTDRKVRQGAARDAAEAWAREVLSAPTYRPKLVDPSLGKGGLVRDVALRTRLRDCLAEAGCDPDTFRDSDIRRAADNGAFRHLSGVPIRTVTLLVPLSRPVLIQRKRHDYVTGRRIPDQNPKATRAYTGGNNHHIEIRVDDATGRWTGTLVSAFQAMQRNTDRLGALRRAGAPSPARLKQMTRAERAVWKDVFAAAARDHGIVDRRDNPALGGRFVMSLAEGETLWMKHPGDGDHATDSYFVVAKLAAPARIYLVPHWDARAASGRRDSMGRRVPDSERELLEITPRDLPRVAPSGHVFAVKVRSSPSGAAVHIPWD
jgi:CRISPR-associated endonuclease Csn1